MKKLLALVLALVMTLGLATISSNAASFTDEATIEYKEAVQIMADLGILVGVGDGSFNAKGTLTRSAAAKMVTYILLGTESADALSAANTGFSDVPANYWGAPYVAYCASKGIVAGRGDGTFGPEDELTGFAFAKMLLVALGNPGSNYVGDTWQINVAIGIKDSADEDGENGLDEELEDINLADPMTREQAAQMARNALFHDNGSSSYKVIPGKDASTAEAKDIERFTKGKTFTTAVEAKNYMENMGYFNDKDNQLYKLEDDASTLAKKNYDVYEELGVVSANQATTENEYTTIYLPDYADEYNFNIETGLDLIGHVVKVYFKDVWTYEKGDKDETKKGTTYSVVDKTDSVKITRDINNTVTASYLKNLLGITTKEFNNMVADQKLAWVYDYADNGTTAMPVFYEEDDGTYTINYSGEILTYKDEDGDLISISFKSSSNVPLAFYVTVDDKANGYYRVGTKRNDDTYVKIVEDEDESYNKIITDIDWMALCDKDSDDPDIDEKHGYATFVAYKYGEVYELKEFKTVTGMFTGSSVNLDKDVYTLYIDGTAYTFYEGMYGGNNLAAIAKLSRDNDNPAKPIVQSTGVLNSDLETGVEYEFYLNGGNKIVAFAPVEEVADNDLIVPVLFYYVDNYPNVDTDEYGKKLDVDDKYSFYLQAVDMSGKVLNLELDNSQPDGDDDKYSYKNSTGFFAETANTTLHPSYQVFKDVNTEDGYYEPTSGNVGFMMTKNMKTVVCYKTHSDTNGTYSYFYDPADLTEGVDAAEGSLKHLSNPNKVGSKDAKFVYDNTDFYLNDTFTCLTITNEGKDLKVKTANGSYGKIQDGAWIYGSKEEDDPAGKYDLETVVIVKDQGAGEGVLFVPEQFTAQDSVSKTYTDANGKTHENEMFYKQTVYIDGVKTEILTKNSNADVGFYPDYEINEDSGAYTLGNRNNNAPYAIGINEIENHNGLITLPGTTLEDAKFDGTKIINVSDYTAAETSVANLGKDDGHVYVLAVQTNDDGDDADYVYIYEVYAAATVTVKDSTGKVVGEYELGNATINASAGEYTLEFDSMSSQTVRLDGVKVTTSSKVITVNADKTVEIVTSEKNCENGVLKLNFDI